jgi:hypothetical protein
MAAPASNSASAPAASAPAPVAAAPATSASSSNSSSSSTSMKKTTKTTSAAPNDPAIASAKSNGQVWVNLDSGVYHKGGRWYGKTKNGKFMSEADAKAAGYKASEKD